MHCISLSRSTVCRAFHIVVMWQPCPTFSKHSVCQYHPRHTLSSVHWTQSALWISQLPMLALAINNHISISSVVNYPVFVPTTSQQVAHTTDRSSQTQSLKNYNFHNISISQHLQKTQQKTFTKKELQRHQPKQAHQPNAKMATQQNNDDTRKQWVSSTATKQSTVQDNQ